MKLNDEGRYYYDGDDKLYCPFCKEEVLLLDFHIGDEHPE
jgi:hypothetical protein